MINSEVDITDVTKVINQNVAAHNPTMEKKLNELRRQTGQQFNVQPTLTYGLIVQLELTPKLNEIIQKYQNNVVYIFANFRLRRNINYDKIPTLLGFDVEDRKFETIETKTN